MDNTTYFASLDAKLAQLRLTDPAQAADFANWVKNQKLAVSLGLAVYDPTAESNVTATTGGALSQPSVYFPARLPKWRKAVGRALAGGRGRLMLLGDSTTVGAGAGTSGQTNLVGARPNNYPSALANALSRLGIPANNGHVFGGQNVIATTVAYEQYDPRVSFPVAGWAEQPSANYLIPGGHFFRSSTSGAVYRFTPTQVVDTIVPYYITNSGLGSMTVDVDGGAALSTINQAGALAVTSSTISCAKGSHAINLTATSASQVYLAGILAYDSAQGGIDILQCGSWGDIIANFNMTTNVWSPYNFYASLAPDLTIVQLTINDINQATTLAAYDASLRTLVAKLKAIGSDVVLMTGLNSDPSPYPNMGNGKSESFYAAVRQVAIDLGCPFLHQAERLGNYAAANAALGMSDTSHGSPALYGDEGLWVARSLAEFAK